MANATPYKANGKQRTNSNEQLGWRLRYRDPRDASNQPERTFWGTAEEAAVAQTAFEAEQASKAIRSAPRKLNAITFEQAYESFYDKYQWKAEPGGAYAGQARPNSTIGNLDQYVQTYLMPQYRTRRIATLTPGEINGYITALQLMDRATGERTGEPLSTTTKEGVGKHIRQILAHAEREFGLAPISDRINKHWGQRQSGRLDIIPSMLDVERLAAAMDAEWRYPSWAPDDVYGPDGQGRGDIVRFLAFSCLRWEECAAMPLSLVRWQRKMMLVNDTASESGGFREFRTDEGKTEAAMRHVLLVEPILGPMRRMRAFSDAGRATEADRDARRLARADRNKRPVNRQLDDRWKLVINSDRGGFMAYSVWRRHLTHARTKSGVSYSAHALRHVGISLLYAAGASREVIAEQAGHSSTLVTDRVYRHLFLVEREEIARRIAEGMEIVTKLEVDRAERLNAADDAEVARGMRDRVIEAWD